MSESRFNYPVSQAVVSNPEVHIVVAQTRWGKTVTFPFRCTPQDQAIFREVHQLPSGQRLDPKNQDTDMVALEFPICLGCAVFGAALIKACGESCVVEDVISPSVVPSQK
jgi:hypothetical protein